MEDANSEKSNFQNLRVLLVEDNVIDRELLRTHLRNLGVTYLQDAANGNEGNFKIDNAFRVGKPFHLLITDWKMPHKDGLSLSKLMRLKSSRHQMAILMITSVSERQSVLEALVSVDDFLIKPVDPKVLEQKINDLIETLDPKTLRKPA